VSVLVVLGLDKVVLLEVLVDSVSVLDALGVDNVVLLLVLLEGGMAELPVVPDVVVVP
jgi:hypothetical protein